MHTHHGKELPGAFRVTLIYHLRGPWAASRGGKHRCFYYPGM